MSRSSSNVGETSALLKPGSNQDRQSYRSTNNGKSTTNGTGSDHEAEPSAEDAQEQVTVMPSMRELAPVLAALWVPVFVASLDGTIVVTLVWSISSSFDASNQAAWLGSSYLLSVACFTPLYGRLADIVGRKACMLSALTFFTTGTILCGTATSLEMLICGRVIAGMGGGGVTVSTSVIMSDLVPLKNRGLMQGLTNIVFGLGSGLGGPIGGWMNDTLGWRKAFLLQVPLLLLDFVLAFIFINVNTPNALVSQSKWSKFKSIDFAGAISLVLGLSSTLIALSMMTSNDKPITDTLVWGGFVLGFISLVFFFYAEAKIASTPILPLRLIRQTTGGAVATANFCLSIVSFGVLSHLPLFFQAVKLETPSKAGLHLIPNSIALSVGSVLAGIYMRNTGRFYLYNLIHAAFVTVSIACFCFFSRNSSETFTFLATVPHGFGTAGVLTCTLIALINSVSRADVAVATSMSYMARNTGQILGVSGSGTIFQALLRDQLRKRITGKNAEQLIADIRHRSAIVPTLPPHLQAAAVESYAFALRGVFMAIGVVSIGTVCSSYFIEDKTLPSYEKKKGSDSDNEDPDVSH